MGDSGQILLANLRSLMSLLFPDYDCTGLTPDDFEPCADKHSVVNRINHSLAAAVDRVHQGFLSEFWQIVQATIDLMGCDMYEFKPKSGTFEPADKSLMSFHYFFLDARQERILFVGSVTKSHGCVDSDSDAVLSLNSGYDSASQGVKSSDVGSSLQEGEHAFSEASQDD